MVQQARRPELVSTASSCKTGAHAFSIADLQIIVKQLTCSFKTLQHVCCRALQAVSCTSKDLLLLVGVYACGSQRAELMAAKALFVISTGSR
jgi:hypothetical protein